MPEDLPKDRAARAQQRLRIKKKNIAEAKKLYDEGLTSIAIAEILGIKPEEVDLYLGM